MITQSNETRAWTPGWRKSQIERLSREKFEWDLIVVGGGITGAGVYREAACRGLKVLLIEQQDFAWGTSSRSSKMVHGGLRYLGSGQFGLANDSVKERQQLLDQLPGLVEPLPFLMGHYKGGFPGPWIFDKLLAIYDWMAGRRFRKFIKRGVSDYWVPGIREAKLKGVTRFADAVTDDARLVMRVLQDGNEHGGQALNYLKALETLTLNGRVCGLKVEDQIDGEAFELKAKSVINATGAWTDTLRASLGHHRVIRPLRGSHLVVPHWRLPVSFSVSFFHPQDKRPVFAFPWEGTTVIGTTDLDHAEDMGHEASITETELQYLLVAANQQFDQANLCRDDVITTWSGVRPVVSNKQDQEVDLSKSNNPSDEKREHAIWNDQGLVSVAGGKLTTYRLIALEVLREAAGALGSKLTLQSLEKPVPFEMPKSAAPSYRSRRLAGRYGAYATNIESMSSVAELQIPSLQKEVMDTDTRWAELLWACQEECVAHLDDLLLRRTRIALLLGEKIGQHKSDLEVICRSALAWDADRWQQEWRRFEGIMAKYYGLPGECGSDAKGVSI